MKFFWDLPWKKEAARDWSKCSFDELLSQFRLENWEQISRSEDRIALLQIPKPIGFGIFCCHFGAGKPLRRPAETRSCHGDGDGKQQLLRPI